MLHYITYLYILSAVVVCIYGRFPYVILILGIFTAHFL